MTGPEHQRSPAGNAGTARKFRGWAGTRLGHVPAGARLIGLRGWLETVTCLACSRVRATDRLNLIRFVPAKEEEARHARHNAVIPCRAV